MEQTQCVWWDLNNRMDLDFFERALRQIENREDKIKSVAEYCFINNVNNEKEVSLLLEKHFNMAVNPSTKVAIFFLLEQIMSMSIAKKSNQFFIALASKIKFFLEQLSIAVVDNEHALAITLVINKWSDNFTFKHHFIEKLKVVAQPLFEKAQKEKFNLRSKFIKYQKNTLIEMLDVKKFPSAQKIYESYTTMIDLNQKLGSFNIAFNRLQAQADNNINQDTILRCKELQKISQGYSNDLEKLIQSYHQCFKLIRDNAIEEYNKFQAIHNTK